MEGVTGFVYRNAHHHFFPGMDKYLTPFLAPTYHHSFKQKEKQDTAPENNAGVCVTPQILTKNAEDFLWAAGEMAALGYREVNLNLGCPASTVVTKGKGAGFLADPEGLDRFLDRVFPEAEKRSLAVSVKTRLGMKEPEELFALLEIFNRYPVSELILHPRVREEFYRGTPHREVFSEVLSLAKMPVCYNGDLFTSKDLTEFAAEFPGADRVMLGRGLIAAPGLVRSYTGKGAWGKKELSAFHDRILEEYLAQVSGAHHTIYKMKELWFYMIGLFPDSKKAEKRIKKSRTLEEYREAVAELFELGEERMER